MRYLLVALSLMLGPAACTQARVGIGVATPGLAIGIDIPVYPDLARVPGYPVYYYPDAGTNYFFYDGLYWVFQGDNWYRSNRYNGPWQWVGPEYVPLYVLQVPVRYYRYPPPYFRGWHADQPPRWGDRWGHDWEARRPGRDHREPYAAPAPLPSYPQPYQGNRAPRSTEQQYGIRPQPAFPPPGQMPPQPGHADRPWQAQGRHPDQPRAPDGMPPYPRGQQGGENGRPHGEPHPQGPDRQWQQHQRQQQDHPGQQQGEQHQRGAGRSFPDQPQ